MLGVRILEIFQRSSPFDTGNNMRSIIIERQPNGWVVTSLGVRSPYNKALETGPLRRTPTDKEKRNIGWFFTRGAGNAARHIEAYYNNNLKSDTANYEEMVEKSKDFPAQNERFLEGLRK